MVLVDVKGVHIPFVIVQASVFMPRPKPVTTVVAEVCEAIVALPLCTDQKPVPLTGALPVSKVVGELMHKV